MELVAGSPTPELNEVLVAFLRFKQSLLEYSSPITVFPGNNFFIGTRLFEGSVQNQTVVRSMGTPCAGFPTQYSCKLPEKT